MINIRSNVFETNSSSTHSISISDNLDGILETIVPNDNGIIILIGGEFGWEWEKYNDALTKANYCAVDNPNNRDMLIKVIKEHTGAKDVVIVVDESWNSSYIDHQSGGTSNKIFETEETLKNFIFNPKCWLFTGNDNESPPSNFHDVEENIKYKYQLKLEGTKEICNLKEKPTSEEIKNTLRNIFSRHPKCEKYFSYPSNKGYEFIWRDKTIGDKLINSFLLFDNNIIIVYNIKEDYDRKGVYVGEKTAKELQLKFELVKL
jgi:hypothetical protein